MSCKDSASKSNNDVGICEIVGKFTSMSMSIKEDILSVCANCCKEGDNLKSCAACKMVKYCNRECQIAHRPMHKRECRKLQDVKLHDEELFKQPPPLGDCTICFQRLPTLATGWGYQTCCGKIICSCSGCMHAPVYDNQGNQVDCKKCPFCRVLAPTSDEEIIERLNKRVEAEDPLAIHKLGVFYSEGTNGYPQDMDKALEYWHRAAELGFTNAYNNIGASCYGRGDSKRDEKKAMYYYELAAMRGDASSRTILGLFEVLEGHMDRALKHYMIAIQGGRSESLKSIKELYTKGHATKDDYTKALKLYQTYLGEIRSDQRDKAAATYGHCRYY